MFRDLCSVRIFTLIDFVYALSVSSNLVIVPRIRNQLFSQSYDSCLQSRSAPSPFPLLLSRLRLVFVSISSMSSLRYRRYILIRSLHVSQPSPPSYSSRYLQCLLYNIDDTPFNSAPFPYPHLRFPTFPSAISTFYLVAFVNVPSYSASTYF